MCFISILTRLKPSVPYIDRMSFGYTDCKSKSTDLEYGLDSVVTAILYHINKALLVSFFVHRRKSRDRFRINYITYLIC